LLKELNKVDSLDQLCWDGKPVHIPLGASVEEMVNMAAIAVIDAQEKQKKKKINRIRKVCKCKGLFFMLKKGYIQ
jgi:malate dehydrogenase (oxaloacetate-decarboxylating)(NADP+)